MKIFFIIIIILINISENKFAAGRRPSLLRASVPYCTIVQQPKGSQFDHRFKRYCYPSKVKALISNTPYKDTFKNWTVRLSIHPFYRGWLFFQDIPGSHPLILISGNTAPYDRTQYFLQYEDRTPIFTWFNVKAMQNRFFAATRNMHPRNYHKFTNE